MGWPPVRAWHWPTVGKMSNRTGFSKIAALALVATLWGCAGGAPREPVVPVAEVLQLPTDVPAFAGPRPDIVGADGVYSLSAEQQAAFYDFFQDARNQGMSPQRRVLRYLTQSVGAFNYDNDTRTAEETYRLEGGNCLSLANITTALARLAGVQVQYQLVEDLPVFEKVDNIVLRGLHVRSVLFESFLATDRDSYAPSVSVSPRRSRVVVDYFPTGHSRFVRMVPESEFTAMYYRNLAAEAIGDADYAKAYWLTRESMKHTPDHPHAINMLAIVYRRSGDETMAENIYRFGIATSDDKLVLMKNYRILLEDQGRFGEAKEIERRIAEYNDADPFEWWYMAEDAYDEANYSEALAYYKKSVEIAPYLHEGYFGMAKSYYQLGRPESARAAMAKALENAGRLQYRSLYEAKLRALSGE